MSEIIDRATPADPGTGLTAALPELAGPLMGTHSSRGVMLHLAVSPIGTIPHPLTGRITVADAGRMITAIRAHTGAHPPRRSEYRMTS